MIVHRNQTKHVDEVNNDTVTNIQTCFFIMRNKNEA